MKTSNKLLIGLLFVMFLLVTIYIGLVKHYQIPKDATLEKTSSNWFDQPESENVSLDFFPSGLLLPILK